MDIRKFLTNGNQPKAPTSTLGDLKKTNEHDTPKSPTRSSPRKHASSLAHNASLSAASSKAMNDLKVAGAGKGKKAPAKSSKRKVTSKSTKEDDDFIDDALTLSSSQSPPPSPKHSNKKSSKSRPRKSPKKAPKDSVAHEATNGAMKKKKERAFQLLDDDDLDANDSPDDDFIPTKKAVSPKKGRKRAARKGGKKAPSLDDEETLTLSSDAGCDGEEVVRKKAKVAAKRRSKAHDVDEDTDKGDQGKQGRKSLSKKKEASAVRVLDSDEDEVTEEDKEAARAERHRKQAMKKALKPDSHGLRNQDISVAVASASTIASSHPSKHKEQPIEKRNLKEMSAFEFFGTDPVVYKNNDAPLQEASTEPPPSPMAVDDAPMEENGHEHKHKTSSPVKVQPEPSKKTPKKTSHKSPKKTPQKTPKKTPQKTPKKTPQSNSSKHQVAASSEEYVLHAPLNPKSLDNNHDHDDHHHKTPSKSPSGGTVTTPQSGFVERRKSYYSYLHREGPHHLGEKVLPTGSPTCLEGLTFVFTGVLEFFEREDLKAAVEKMGARVVGSVSKKTSYVVVGRDAGPSKLEKIQQMNIPKLDETGLLELIKTKTSASSTAKPAKSPVVKAQDKQKTEAFHHVSKRTAKDEPVEKEVTPLAHKSPHKVESEKMPSTSSLPHHLKQEKLADADKSDALAKSKSMPVPSALAATSSQTVKTGGDTELWVDKYRPKNLKNVIGQQGDRSCLNKLISWLRNWNKNLGVKPNTNPYAHNPDGAGFKAALLSGPPGIGKTTSAHLVCKDLGISVVELNASDTRSKKSLETWVSALLQSKSMDNLTTGSAPHNPNLPEHCLIMDEVDGMAGNEDRGGIAELIGLIKKSKVPVICVCNDRAAQKIRSLANHCFDLRFYKPRPEQIKAAMLSMACKERVKIPPAYISEVIEATNYDIRQIVNQLQMYSSQSKESMGKYHGRKDVRMGIFQLAEKIFSYEENKNMTVPQRMDLFFQDYSLAPLFVEENYASVWPHRASSLGSAKQQQRKAVQLLAKTADSLSYGDMVEKQIRSSNDWSLLNGQALLSCAIPSWLMSGTGRVNNFPSWFGKTSHANRIQRVVQQLTLHTSLATGVSGKTAFALDYVPALHRAIIGPLLTEGEAGVAKVIEIFEQYDLIREDLDALLEADQWPGLPDEWKQVDSKIKSSLTRQYNKSGHKTHYAVTAVAGGSKRRGGTPLGGEDDMEGLLGGEDSNEAAGSDDDDSGDPMVKANAGKGRGRGRDAHATGRGGSSRGGGRGSRGNRSGRGTKK